MARVTAPLLSLAASGQIGHTVTYQVRKGRRLARAYRVSPDPRTASQAQKRDAMAWLQLLWLNSAAIYQDAFIEIASRRNLPARQVMLGYNLSALNSAAEISDLVFCPPQVYGIAPALSTATPGVGNITFALTTPPLPPSWSINGARWVILRQQPPAPPFVKPYRQLSDSTFPYTVTQAGLGSGLTYVCGAWFRFLTPSGKFRNGPSISHVVTTL